MRAGAAAATGCAEVRSSHGLLRVRRARFFVANPAPQACARFLPGRGSLQLKHVHAISGEVRHYESAALRIVTDVGGDSCSLSTRSRALFDERRLSI